MPSIPVAKVEKFVSQDTEHAIHLTHVWLDVEGQRLAATNGHELVVARSTVHEGETAGFIPVLAFETIRKMIQRHKKESDFPYESLITMKAFAEQIIISNEWTHEVYTIQRPSFGESMKFPKFDSVIPKAKGTPSITLDRDYISSMCKDLGGDSVGISFWVKDNSSAVLLSVGDSDAIGVLMPQKYEVEASDVLKKVRPISKEESVVSVTITAAESAQASL